MGLIIKSAGFSSNCLTSKMTYQFEVIKVKWHHNMGDFIFARHLGSPHHFNIPEGSLFGDIPIYHYTEMHFITDEFGNPRLDIFIFRPVSLEWLPKNYFTEGQQVKLTIAQ